MPYKDPEAKRAQARSWAKAKRLRWTKAEQDKRRAYQSAYYAAHKEELAAKAKVYNASRKEERIAKSRTYYHAHKEERIAKNREWKAANKEKYAAKYREYNAVHKTERADKALVYNAAHKEEIAATFRAYRLAHPEYMAANYARRRARKAGASVNDLTAAQWREIVAAYDHRCVYCGRKMQRLTKDPIIPLVSGGTHTFSNVVPACQSCNSRKGARAPLIPVQPLLLTVAASRSARSKP